MLKAYIDDSNMSHGPVAVLAGWVARAQSWAKFSDDWTRVLRMSPRIGHFKWKDWRGASGEFAGVSDARRIEKLNLLIDVLSEHAPLGVASVTSNRLHQQIFGQN